MAAQTGTNKGTAKKIGGFFRGVKAEVKKVSWPNKKELVNHTAVVIAVCAIMALLVWILDSGLHALLSLFIG